jgi:hypothetical protein
MQDNRSFFTTIFTALMIFSLLVGVSTVAFIYSWPWEKSDVAWKPGFRLAAICGEKKEPCGIAYGELADARAKGLVVSIDPPEANGEVEESNNWLMWSRDSNGIYEVKTSSWHFQTVVRYRVDKDTPVLVAYQDVDVSKAFTYGLGAAIFMMVGLYLRKLRS